MIGATLEIDGSRAAFAEVVNHADGARIGACVAEPIILFRTDNGVAAGIRHAADDQRKDNFRDGVLVRGGCQIDVGRVLIDHQLGTVLPGFDQ